MKFHFHRCHISTKMLSLGLLVASVLLLQRGLSIAAPTIDLVYPNEGSGGGIDLQDNIAVPGDTNVKLMDVDITIPSQTVLLDGSNYVIAEGDALTLMSDDSDLRFISEDGDSAYTTNAQIVRSSDGSLDGTDTVVVGAPYDTFPSTPTLTGFYTATLWLDQDSDSLYDVGEDMFRVVYDEGNISDGDTIRLFADNELYATSGITPTTVSNVHDVFSDMQTVNGNWQQPAFLNDNDSDGYLSAGDEITVAGGANTIDPLDSNDGVCFDGSISDDSEFDYTDADNYEVIWWDADGDCSSFDTGVDVVLTGKSGGTDVAPSGTSTEFGTEGEVGWNDARNENDDYSCARSDTCFELFYSGVSGTNWSNGSDFTTDTVFFDASTLATDGLSTIGDGWQGGYEDFNTFLDFSEETNGSDSLYVYVDANANTQYDEGETILLHGNLDDAGSAAVATGQTVRLIYQK
jgi:hypothetical protein